MLKLSPHFCVRLGLLALILAALCAPSLVEYVCRFEDQPQLFRGSEVLLFRSVLALVGISVLLCVYVWNWGAGHAWRRRIEVDFAAYAANELPPSRRLRIFVRLWTALTFAVALGLIQTMRWSFRYHDKGILWYDSLALENGLWESLTAVSLAVAGVFLTLSVIKYRDSFGLKLSRWPPLLLALLFFFGVGEEVNWGQFWFGFETPAVLRSINTQMEFNAHNIDSHMTNHLMTLFFLGYVGFLPLMVSSVKEIRYVCRRLNIPVCPISFVPFALIGVLMSDHGLFSNLWGNPPWRISEGRETLLGMTMMGMSMFFYLFWKDISFVRSARGDR